MSVVPHPTEGQAELFDLPPGSRRPLAKVIILTGPSGSGKTSLSSRIGIPALPTDHFYRDEDAPDMPRLATGVIDWDDPRSWNLSEAVRSITELCLTGRTEVPIYDIPSNRKTGERQLDLGGQSLFIAEGIFASLLVKPLADEGLLAGALCIARSPLRNAWFRFLRDLGEARKPLHVLLYRGVWLAAGEPKRIKRWVGDGCQPVRSLSDAEQLVRSLSGSVGRA